MSKITTQPNTLELEINRSINKATWITAIVAVLALLLSLFSVFITLKQSSELITVSAERYFGNFSTELMSYGEGGLITVYWAVFISNNGGSASSVLFHDIKVIEGQRPLTSYPDLRQGLYIRNASEFEPVSLPMMLEAGESRLVYLKSAVVVIPPIYTILAEKLVEEPDITFQELMAYLHSTSTDIYGNTIDYSGDTLHFPNIPVKEQVFSISFTTARNNTFADYVSWYAYSGLQERGIVGRYQPLE